MIEIKYGECSKVTKLYNYLKDIILSKKDNPTYYYAKKQHRLYEELDHPGISKKFYNESGEIEFENINGEIIHIIINRWHAHQHNGLSELNSNPSYSAIIYKKNYNDKEVLWELKIKSGTMYFKAEVTSLELPIDDLKEKTDIKEFENLEEKIEEENTKEEKVLETRVLLDELFEFVNKYNESIKQKELIISERNTKIEKVTNEIMSEYLEVLNECDNNINFLKKEMNNYDNLITSYSTFNINIVGNTIKELLSVIECRDFVYKEATHSFKKRVHGPIDSWDEDDKEIINLIVTSNNFNNFYNGNKIDELIRNGNALLLPKNNNNEITFYSSKNGKIELLINFYQFNYIKDFIDRLIQYRFENGLETFDEKNMIICLQKFIQEYKDTILKNYSSKIDNKILKLTL